MNSIEHASETNIDSEISSDDFRNWLRDSSRFYQRLNDFQKNEVLRCLISISRPKQLIVLTETLPILLFRDFVTHLPYEVFAKLFSYLDVQDLLSCCQVSKSWKMRTESLARLWSIKCKDLGLIIPSPAIIDNSTCSTFFDSTSPLKIPQTSPLDVPAALEDDRTAMSSEDRDACEKEAVFAEDIVCDYPSSTLLQLQKRGILYKNLYLKSFRFFAGMSTGRSLNINHNFIPPGQLRVTALSFHNDRLFIGSDDRVQIWSMSGNRLLNCFTTHSVCAMIIRHTTLYIASFNCTVESWDINTGRRKHTFWGHTKALTVIDVTEDEQYVVTGSQDLTLKLWYQTENDVELLTTLQLDNNMPKMIFKVKFLPSEAGQVTFVAFYPRTIKVHQINLSTMDGTAFSYFPGLDTLYSSMDLNQSLPTEIVAATFDKRKAITKFLTLEVKEKALVLKDEWLCSEFAEEVFIFAVGLRFMLALSRGEKTSLLVMDRKRKKCISRMPLSKSTRLLGYFKRITACESSWLDGLDLHTLQPNGPVFAGSFDDHITVMLGSWKKEC